MNQLLVGNSVGAEPFLELDTDNEEKAFVVTGK